MLDTTGVDISWPGMAYEGLNTWQHNVQEFVIQIKMQKRTKANLKLRRS